MSRSVAASKLDVVFIINPGEGELFSQEIIDDLINGSMPAKHLDDDLDAAKFISDCYFTTVVNLINMAYLPMDLESHLNEMQAFMGTCRQIEPKPRPWFSQ